MNMKKKQIQHNSEISSLIREKELLANNVVKMESLLDKYINEFKNGENERVAMCRELKDYQRQLEMQNKLIGSLDKMKLQYLNDIKDLTKKIENLNETLCTHEDNEVAMQAKVIELTGKLNHQIDISHAAISDRKLYCQQYKEAKENEDQLKKKSDILSTHVNELKDSIKTKSDELHQCQVKLEKLDLAYKKINDKLTKEHSELNAVKLQCKHLDEQTHNYLQTISSKEKEIENLQSKIFQLNEENKLLQSQHNIKTKEISELQVKLRLSEDAIRKEHELYLNLENTTKLLNVEIVRLTGEKNSLMCKINDLEKLKQSFFYAQQELQKERFKNSALENEMQKPLNIHRWRVLKGTDPEKYELLENYQLLQKQLVNKTIEAEKKNRKLSNMSKVVDQLKNVVTRQKTLQERSQAEINQRLLEEKNDKIKILTSEINMYETYMASYQAEITRLKDELRSLKLTNFFNRKKVIVPAVNG